jgi:hypothetical protein
MERSASLSPCKRRRRAGAGPVTAGRPAQSKAHLEHGVQHVLEGHRLAFRLGLRSARARCIRGGGDTRAPQTHPDEAFDDAPQLHLRPAPLRARLGCASRALQRLARRGCGTHTRRSAGRAWCQSPCGESCPRRLWRHHARAAHLSTTSLVARLSIPSTIWSMESLGRTSARSPAAAQTRATYRPACPPAHPQMRAHGWHSVRTRCPGARPARAGPTDGRPAH